MEADASELSVGNSLDFAALLDGSPDKTLIHWQSVHFPQNIPVACLVELN